VRIYTESLRGRDRMHHGEAFDELLKGDRDGRARRIPDSADSSTDR